MSDVSEPVRVDRVSWSSFLGQRVVVTAPVPEAAGSYFDVAETALSNGAWLSCATEPAQTLLKGIDGGDILSFGQFDGVGWWEWQAAVLEGPVGERIRVGAPEGLSRRDRRRHRRVKVGVPVIVATTSEGDLVEWTGHTDNLSQGGMAVEFGEGGPQEGEEVAFSLRPPGYEPIVGVARMMGDTPTGLVRFQFTQQTPSEADALAAFVTAAMAAGSASAWTDSVERRRSSRYDLHVPVQLLVSGPAGTVSVPGTTRDVGKGGVAIDTSGPKPEVDASIAVQMDLPEGSVMFAGRVVSLAGDAVRVAFSEEAGSNPLFLAFLERGAVMSAMASRRPPS